MPVTRRMSLKSEKKVSIANNAEASKSRAAAASDDSGVEVLDIFPHPSSPTTSNARAKKKYRHKRSRSINRPTIPLVELGEPLPKTVKASSSPSTSSTLSVRTRSKSPSRSYTIRPMKMKDIASVYHIGNSIFVASEYPTLFRTWDDFAVVENYEISSEFCFVAESDDNDDENEIIGFLLGETVTKARVGTRGYIQWVAVLPPYRRMGIASALIDRFVKVAASENISLLLADTPADNDPAISMFEKAGLCYKTDHVYLTCQLRDIERKYVDEDMSVNFSYTAKKNRIVIRNMEIEDLYPIHGIGEEIFTKRSANLYNFWDEHLVLQSYLSDPEFSIVATVKEEEKEKVVGFAFGTTIEKPRSSWKYGYLVWLGCAKEYQGIGLASQLYTVMLELFSLEKVRMVMIDTQQNNEGALRFFRKQGFGHDEEHVYFCNSPMDTES